MNYEKRSKKELADEILKLKEELDSYKEPAGIEGKDQKQLEFELGERTKELKCHNTISKLISDSDFSDIEILHKIVQIIPEAWQFPHIAESMIMVRNKIFKTPGYKKSKYQLTQDIKINNEVIGRIEVCYPVKLVPHEKLIFLPEESDLLYSIAVRIGNYVRTTETSLSLTATEKQYRNIIENINDIIFEIDTRGIVTYISPSIMHILGYSDAEIARRSFSHFVGETNAGELFKRLRVLPGKKSIWGEYLIKTKSGEERWIRISTKAVFEDETFKGGTGTLIDITEKKLIELKLQESEALYSSVLRTSPDAVVIAKLDGIITFCSPVMNKFFGADSSYSFTGHHILE